MIELTNIEEAMQGVVSELSCLTAPCVAFCIFGGVV